MKLLLFLTVSLLAATSVFGADPGQIFGLWRTEGDDARLELYKCGDAVCGKIVWLKVPNYIDSSDGPVGKTKTDRKNPDPALRTHPILGLQIMKGFIAKGRNRWENGTCYNPQTGKSYKSRMFLESPVRLELRGYIGIPLIGRTFLLSRFSPEILKKLRK